MSRPSKIDLLVLSVGFVTLVGCLFLPYCAIRDLPGTRSHVTDLTIEYGFQSDFQLLNLAACALVIFLGLLKTKDRTVQRALLITFSTLYAFVLFVYNFIKQDFMYDAPLSLEYHISYDLLMLSDVLLFSWAYVRAWGK